MGWGKIQPIGKPLGGYIMDRFTKIVASLVVAEAEIREYGHHRVLVNRPEATLAPEGEPVAAPSQADFGRALDEFISYVNAMIVKHTEDNLKGLQPGSVSTMHGQKYVRLVKSDSDGGSRSAYGFVNKLNGDILMAAGWGAPAKHARGNIFDKSTWKAAGPYGMAYLR